MSSSASFTSFPTIAYSALANRLPHCSLDMSGTHVRNLRTFALAGPFSKVSFPLICMAPFLNIFRVFTEMFPPYPWWNLHTSLHTPALSSPLCSIFPYYISDICLLVFGFLSVSIQWNMNFMRVEGFFLSLSFFYHSLVSRKVPGTW